jgi:hypothetical protein
MHQQQEGSQQQQQQGGHNSSKANNSRATRNIGNISSRRDPNSSREGSNIRYSSHRAIRTHQQKARQRQGRELEHQGTPNEGMQELVEITLIKEC